jgi:hypothetical protein
MTNRLISVFHSSKNLLFFLQRQHNVTEIPCSVNKNGLRFTFILRLSFFYTGLKVGLFQLMRADIIPRCTCPTNAWSILVRSLVFMPFPWVDLS